MRQLQMCKMSVSQCWQQILPKSGKPNTGSLGCASCAWSPKSLPLGAHPTGPSVEPRPGDLVLQSGHRLAVVGVNKVQQVEALAICAPRRVLQQLFRSCPHCQGAERCHANKGVRAQVSRPGQMFFPEHLNGSSSRKIPIPSERESERAGRRGQQPPSAIAIYESISQRRPRLSTIVAAWLAAADHAVLEDLR